MCPRSRIRYVFVIVVTCVVACPLVATSALCSQGEVPVGLDDIAASVLPVCQAVQRLSISYTASLVDSNSVSIHCIQVQDCTFCRENRHVEGSVHDIIDLNHTIQRYDGQDLEVLYLHQRYLERSSGSLGRTNSWKLREDPLLRSIGWWPRCGSADQYHGNEAVSPDFQQIFASGEYVVRPESESVEGSQCLVVEKPGRDVLWLDPKCGFAIRQRQITEPLSGQLCLTQLADGFDGYALDDSTQALKLWVPRVVKTKTSSSHATSAMMDIVFKVNAVSVNENAPPLLPLAVQPGTLISNRNSGKVSQIPGGEDLLDETVRLARQMRIRPTVGTWKNLGAGIMIAVLVLGISYRVFVKRRTVGLDARW